MGLFPFLTTPGKIFSIPLLIPKYELIQKEDTFTYAINSLKPIKEMTPFKKPSSFNSTLPKIQLTQHLPHFEGWRETIEKALTQIRLKNFDKVVLARCSSYKLENKIEPLFLLHSLFQKVKHSYLFFFQKSEHKSFISAFP